ncbi:MAG TPA: nuclease-related domain-containing protein [Candidatus Wujingus californicus]|uniref:nuclease-related domain-containing protein n=1 Tax=Candidatus Wujingus californicus TaxID=3367618 RepID=UPI001DB1F842|nr:NERD domain-containing protein [Planctomycetota bacterium]MDO8131961.1 nuclease-related domain-containing protein [Candidatus Brocadiales bacterium]
MPLLNNLKSWYKGWDGELTVKLIQWRYLDKKTYHVFNNVTLPNLSGGTTQIDHIIVSVYGIFVVETKNLNGWIYGNEKDTKWTQVFFSKKYPFQNPLRQNHKHIKTISEILKIPENKFHSVIMFIGDCELKTKMPENILLKGYTKYIKSKTENILTEKEVLSIIEGITAYKLPSSFETKRKHINHVKDIKENKSKIYY